ncbi:5213_t:CDS:2, partial [Acaulospora colombiana]
LVHRSSHPAYMNTSLPSKWAHYILERQDSDLDTLWEEMVDQNNQAGGDPFPFTKGTVKHYMDHLLRTNDTGNVGSDNEPNIGLEGDDTTYDPCPPPAFMDEELEGMDIDTWADEGDSIPPVLPPGKDSDDNDDEEPEYYGAISPGPLGEMSQEVNGKSYDEGDNQQIKAALDLLASLGHDMEPDEVEEFDASLLILKRVIRRHQQRIRMA